MPPPSVPSGPRPSTTSSVREFIEMIATVAMLVLLLKIFVAEAFIIPTGSMATTLLGAHKMVVCPQCGLEFSVNCSSEREPPYDPVIGCVCPNCRYQIDLRQERHPPSCASGDRLVVGKFLYDLHLNRVERQDIVVFKYPDTPQRHNEAINYIKRLVGKPGETIAVHQGDLYVYPDPNDSQTPPLTYPGRPRPDRPEELWVRDYMYENDTEALELFRQGKFRRIQKSPNKILALRRLVYDNDHPAKDLAESHFPPRWAAEEAVQTSVTLAGTPTDYRRDRQKADETHAWISDGGLGFRHPARPGDLAWLRYRHLVADRSGEPKHAGAASSESQPELITDFLGYDTWKSEGSFHGPPSPNWVGDLMLECTVNIESAASPQSGDQLVLELSRGVDRFQARWDLSTGQCTLVRITAAKEQQLQSQPTSLRQGDNHFVRFANVDEKLVVWVDRSLPFGGGVTYASPAQSGPAANDLQPASIGVRGSGVRVTQLRLWRDTYYTLQPGRGDTPLGPENWSNPDRWQALGDLPVETFYVQPGHYLCMGDNSPESSDGRSWGLVPQRLLLGRALVVYYPLQRIGPIE